MKTMSIKINLVSDVIKFVQEASKVEGNVTVERDIYKVDGKSLLGIMSINPSKRFTVTYPEVNSEQFETFLLTLY